MSILKENLSFETNSPIWGIKYNSPYLALEVRNQEEETVEYVILNESLEIINSIIPQEDWLINIEALTNNELLLTTFEEGESPLKKDILFYNIETGNEELIQNSSLVEVNTNELSILDHKTQEVSQWVISNKQDKDVTYPAHYPQESEHLQTVASFLKNVASKDHVVSTDYLETKNNIIISYFCLENEILNSYLLITDLEGAPIHQFTTGEKLNGIAFDTFFLVENRLYYIAYKNTLSTISL